MGYTQQRQWAKGLALLEKASLLAPNNADILTDLAVAYMSSLNVARLRNVQEGQCSLPLTVQWLRTS